MHEFPERMQDEKPERSGHERVRQGGNHDGCGELCDVGCGLDRLHVVWRSGGVRRAAGGLRFDAATPAKRTSQGSGARSARLATAIG